MTCSPAALAAPATNAATNPAVGPPSEQIKKLAGKTVYFTDNIQVLHLGESGELETVYLRALLERNGVKAPAWHGIDQLQSGDILVLCEPAVPEFTYDELQDPVNAERLARAKDKLRAYQEGGRDKLLAAAKAKGAIIVEQADAHAFFGLGGESSGWVKRYQFQELAGLLDRRLPEIKIEGQTLADVVDLLRDLTGQTITVDWEALSKVGVEKEKPIKLALNNVPLKDVLDALLQQASGAKLKVFSDGTCLLITSAEAGDKLRTRHPGVWLTPAELRDPPAAAIEPTPELPAALMQRIPKIKFEEVPLEDVIDFLKDVTGQKFEVDYDALAASKVTKTTPISVQCVRTPLYRVLELVSSAVPDDAAVFYLTKTGTLRLTTRAAAQAARDKAVVFDR